MLGLRRSWGWCRRRLVGIRSLVHFFHIDLCEVFSVGVGV
jgi:hypothetical protein